jgi:hypothetical protein
MKLKTKNLTKKLKMTGHGQHNLIDLNKKHMTKNGTQQVS